MKYLLSLAVPLGLVFTLGASQPVQATAADPLVQAQNQQPVVQDVHWRGHRYGYGLRHWRGHGHHKWRQHHQWHPRHHRYWH